MSEEIWKPVPLEDYEDFYEVSNLGRVRSLSRYVPNGSGYRLSRGRILKHRMSGSHTPYDSVMFSISQEKKQVLVHRLVLMAFLGPPPKNMETRHLDNNPRNNRLTNLEWNTHLNNMRDQDRFGTRARGLRHGRYTQPESTLRGEQQPKSKLTAAKVVKIKARLNKGHKQYLIARDYKVSASLVQAIKAGRAWRHVTTDKLTKKGN